MPRSRCLLWGVVPVLLWTSSLRAQPDIPKDCMGSSSPGGTCESVSRSYVQYFVGKLSKNDATDDQIRDARTRLLDPYQKGAKVEFELLYSKALASELVPLMNMADRPGVRLNAMIIATRLTDPKGATMLVQLGVTDANPGVRYWAGVAAREISNRGIDPEIQKKMAAVLETAIDKETSPYVRSPMVAALLNLAGAEQTVLKALDRGVDALAASPGVSPAADIESLVKVYQKLAVAGQAPPESVKNLARVSFRYLSLASILLDEGRVPALHKSQYSELAVKADTSLRWAVAQLNPNLTQPAAITGDASLDKWTNVRLRNADWTKALTGDLKIDAASLEVLIGK